jgi:hypothetical protein
MHQPLPPTHEVHMSGLPGFRATVEYVVTAVIDRGIVKKATSFFPKQDKLVVFLVFLVQFIDMSQQHHLDGNHLSTALTALIPCTTSDDHRLQSGNYREPSLAVL